MKVLISGCSGFIGFHLSQRLLKDNKYLVLGIDNMNSYYDLKLKKERLKILKKYKKFKFIKCDISKLVNLEKSFKKFKPQTVINLAAQAGVRYSINNPDQYFDSNILGFYNILKCSKKYKVGHFLFASSSSVYGASNSFPIKENSNTDRPLSFYAATKKSNEVMAYSFSNIYKLPATSLRFFTVYGPFGRPDMSLFLFTNNILKSKKINVFNSGNHVRDFTFVDDVTDAVEKLIRRIPDSNIPYKVYNIGSNRPYTLKKYIKIIGNYLGKIPILNLQPKQPGDVYKTHADVSRLKKTIKFGPPSDLKKGIKSFIDWYLKYYKK